MDIGSGMTGAAAGFSLLLGLLAVPVSADQTNVAVAANFANAATEIGAAFRAATGHEAVFSFGATGQLYAQISQDAPFEVFLSADNVRTVKAIDEGFGVEGTDFTYAIGKIVLWSADAALVKGEETLKAGTFTKIAMANPETAPYGAAAVEAMKTLGVYDGLRARIVQGTNIAQTFQFVETGNAELGFVALSQIAAGERGSRWVVPAGLYTPIRQDAVLLVKGERSAAARAFLDFLEGPAATALIEAHGYGTGSAN